MVEKINVKSDFISKARPTHPASEELAFLFV
jgi:hypothetical protein